jgi:hypothetical protein
MSLATSRDDRSTIRILALGFAAAVHLLTLFLILARHQLVSSPASPILDLELTPRAPLPELRSQPVRREPGWSAKRSAPPPPAEAAAPRAAPQDLNAPSPAPAAPASTPGSSSNLGAALRGSVGCAFAEVLSPAEREACRERLVKGRSSDPSDALPVVSPQARAAFEAGARRDDWIHQPFLAEKPKNGCRPMVVHKDLPVQGGAQSHEDWTTSVVCGKTF